MLETQENVIQDASPTILVDTHQEQIVLKKKIIATKIGYSAFILGIICFIWAFINVVLFAYPAISDSVQAADTTPIFKAWYDSKNVAHFTLSINGILFVLINIILLGLSVSYFVIEKDFFNQLKQRFDNNKDVFISLLVLMSFATFIYLFLFIVGFVPPSIGRYLTPENGSPITGLFTLFFNWDSRTTTVRNAGYYVMIVIFTLSLLSILASVILFYGFNWIYKRELILAQKRKAAKEQKLLNNEGKEKFSLREFFAKAREAKALAKQEQMKNNSLKQNLDDVSVNNNNDVSIKPEIIDVDQGGSLNQETINEMPKIDQDLTPGLDKSEPRRLGKLIADIKNKKESKGTNINKKAVVAAPTKEINDLVKQLMPD